MMRHFFPAFCSFFYTKNYLTLNSLPSKDLGVVSKAFLWVHIFFLLLAPQQASAQVEDYLRSGKAQIQMNNHKLALQDFEEAIRLRKNFAEAYFWRGIAYFNLKNYPQAFRSFDQAQVLAPERSQYLHSRYECYATLNNYALVLKHYEEVFVADSSEAWVHAEKAALLLFNKDYGRALYHANRALELDPYQVSPLAIRGMAHWGLKKGQSATEDFYNFLRDAQQAKDWFFLALQVSLHGLQDEDLRQKAEQWAFQAVQREDNFIHNQLYAQLLYHNGKKLNCLEVAHKAVSLAKKEGTNYTQVQKLLDELSESTVDDIPPLITLVSPPLARGGIVVSNRSEINIIGKASDESGIKEVLINGNPARVLANGDFNGVLLLKKDMNSFEIEASDLKGNVQRSTFQLLKEPIVSASQKKKKYKALGQSYALIFATNEYEYWGNLLNPVKDAETIAQDLREIYGFETDLVINATQAQVILKLKEYLQKSYQANDQLLIFFAGHGQFDQTFREGYLVTRDSRLDDDTKISYLPHSVLRSYVNNINCKHILLMMDVCFGGTFDPLLAAKGVRGEALSEDISPEEFIRRKLSTVTRKYITSGGKEYVPDGTPGQHSPFARKFLEALRSYGGKDQILTLSEVVSYLEKISPEPHAGEFGTNEPGSDFIFVAK